MKKDKRQKRKKIDSAIASRCRYGQVSDDYLIFYRRVHIAKVVGSRVGHGILPSLAVLPNHRLVVGSANASE